MFLYLFNNSNYEMYAVLWTLVSEPVFVKYGNLKYIPF